MTINIAQESLGIDHNDKIQIKPPFRIHSNKKAGIKPKLVLSIVFKNGEVWTEIERVIREELATLKLPELPKKKSMQLDFLNKIF
jgi:hypothetical protein